MAELREVIRASAHVPAGSWPGGVGGVLNVGQIQIPGSAGGTILRSLSYPSVCMSVGQPGTGTPPEDWWQQAELTWMMWSSTSAGTSPPPYGDEPSVLYAARLRPTLVASPSEPTAYYVRYEGPADGFESRGQRKSATGGTIFYNSGLRWEDPLGGLNTAAFTSINVETRALDVVIFGLTVV